MTRRLRTVIAITLLPALMLSAVWNWVRDRSRAIAVPTIAVAGDVVETVRVAHTPVMSVRRVAASVAWAATRDRRADAIDQVVADLASTECLVMTANGITVTDVRSRTGVVGASAVPVIIAAAAADELGATHRSSTVIAGTEPVDGRILGDLHLIGGGDPFLASDELASTNDVELIDVARINTLVRALVASAVVAIDGDIVGVDDRYTRVPRGPDDPAMPAALVVDGGRILTSPVNRGLDPAQTAARTLYELLIRAGISVSGTVRVGPVADGVVTLAVVEGAELVALSEAVARDDSVDGATGIAPWNWAIEVAIASGTGTDTASGLNAVSDAVATWGVPRPVLRVGDALADSTVSCQTLLAAYERLGSASVLIERGRGDDWLMVGALEAGLEVVAIGDEDALRAAIDQLRTVIDDGAEVADVNELQPLGGVSQ
jgi:hypothetical protein